MPCQAIDSSNLPYIEQQRKCPKPDDGFHIMVWDAFLRLFEAGLQPVTVSLGCGCKWKWIDIPSQVRGAKHERHLKKVKKPEAAKVQDRAIRKSEAEKRARFDEAQLPLLLPTTRRRRQ